MSDKGSDKDMPEKRRVSLGLDTDAQPVDIGSLTGAKRRPAPTAAERAALGRVGAEQGFAERRSGTTPRRRVVGTRPETNRERSPSCLAIARRRSGLRQDRFG